MLVILDNVDQPALLSAAELALLPAAEWLHVCATSRLDPGRFGPGRRDLATVPVDALPEAEALALLRDLAPQKLARPRTRRPPGRS